MDRPEDRQTIPHTDVMGVLLERAEHVRTVLLQMMNVIRDPATARTDALEAIWPTDVDDATRLANAAKVINDLHSRLFKNEKSRPWLMFVRCIDHGARHANETNGSAVDLERARIAREYYRRSFPELEQKLTDSVVLRAITEWRKQPPKGAKSKSSGKHWVAIHEAIKCFMPDAPTAESLSQEWRERFPNATWDAKNSKR